MDVKACEMASATINNIKKNAPTMPMPEIIKHGLKCLRFTFYFYFHFNNRGNLFQGKQIGWTFSKLQTETFLS